MAMSNCWKNSAATISASAAPDADFKTCCMPGGRFDGSDRDDYFQGVMPPPKIERGEPLSRMGEGQG